jgi:hypothetical protein
MSFLRRPPHAGWFVVLTLALCILAVNWAATTERRALRLAHEARRVLDSLAAGRWVQLAPGDSLACRRVGR